MIPPNNDDRILVEAQIDKSVDEPTETGVDEVAERFSLRLGDKPTMIAPKHHDRVAAVGPAFECVENTPDHRIGEVDRRQVALDPVLPLLVVPNVREVAVGAPALTRRWKILQIILLVSYLRRKVTVHDSQAVMRGYGRR